jgi:DNA-cytosine methyltransferase
MAFPCVYAKHVAMSITSKPEKTLVSLFAGCGGSSLGYKQAGYEIKLAVEWDTRAADVYQRNFPETSIHVGDIADLTAEEVLQITGLEPGELDVLDGSPPCQGFSTAGTRKFADSRNRLFEEYIRFLEVFKPKMLVMENVSGLRKGKMKLMFAEMTRALKEAGYRISCRELNAWWYGVAQDRRRLIWVGVREDLSMEPSHPLPTVRRPVSVREALQHLLQVEALEEWKGDGPPIANGETRRWQSADRVSGTMTNARKRVLTSVEGLEEWAGGTKRRWRPSSKTSGTLPAIRPLRVLDIQIKNPDFENKWKPGNGVGPTLMAQRPPILKRNGLMERNSGGQAVRYMTIEEAKVLQGFPEWFDLHESEYRFLGNSVCPPMAEAVGTHLRSLLDSR